MPFLLALILLCSPLSAAEPKLLLPVDGSNANAELVSAADGKLVFLHEGKMRELAVGDLVNWGSPIETSGEQQLLLADGGLLVAEIAKSEGDQLTVRSALFGELSVPLESLAGVMFHPPADAQRRDELAVRVWAAKGDVDRLILDNGDELTGTVLSLDKAAVEFEMKVGKVKVEFDRIAALAFNPTLAHWPRVEGPRVMVGLDDGSRLVVGSLEVAAGKAGLSLTHGAKWSCDSARVVSLQTLAGGRAVYLSDLKPSGYRHIPFLDLSWPHQADRNVLGTQLRAGGKLYLKGVGMHSASRLSFPLDVRFRRFAAEVAIDSETAGRGSVVFRVFVDNEQKYASPVIRGDSPVLPISVDLPEGARSLSLIVDFADRGDEQDHANWLNARLLE